jgi:hypothetical protein
MTGIRLLMAMLVICSVSAFAQGDPGSPVSQACTVVDLYCVAAGPSAAQASRFRIDQLSDPFLPGQNSTESQKLLLEPFPQNSKEDEILLKRDYGQITAKLNPDSRMVVPFLTGDDSYCLKIRSYTVARDSKNSDSVHPTGYTTCVAASRFRLRTTEGHQDSKTDSHLIER